MKKSSFLTIILLVTAFTLTGCGNNDSQVPNEAKLANPASANCVDKGGKLEIRTNRDGQYGICKFSDGSECDEWAFFRGACSPKSPDTIKNTPETEQIPADCPTEVKPVCAKIQVQCIKAPCDPVFETIDNYCLAKQRGAMLLGMTDGRCAKDMKTECMTNGDCKLPVDYSVASDCPYKAACLDKSCVVVCPNSKN
jgi:putative hemolysin